jgi:hypothetical protein
LKLDEIAPNYKRACERWPTAPALEQHRSAVALCFEQNNHAQIECVKSFVESVCVTILNDFGKPLPDGAPTSTQLLVEALRILDRENTRGVEKLDSVLSAFVKLSNALSDMRNGHGAIAHGKDAFLDALTDDHTRAFVLIGDSLLGVLLSALEGKEPDLINTRDPYERLSRFHDRVDQAVTVTARIDEEEVRPTVVVTLTKKSGDKDDPITLRVEASRLLYGVDRGIYKDVFDSAPAAVEVFEDTAGEAAYGLPIVATDTHEPSDIDLSVFNFGPYYNGPLNIIRDDLVNWMLAEGLDPTQSIEDGFLFIESLLSTLDEHLGLDWDKRDVLQAGIRVACKDVLVHFGLEIGRAKEEAKLLVQWLLRNEQAVEFGRIIS